MRKDQISPALSISLLDRILALQGRGVIWVLVFLNTGYWLLPFLTKVLAVPPIVVL